MKIRIILACIVVLSLTACAAQGSETSESIANECLQLAKKSLGQSAKVSVVKVYTSSCLLNVESEKASKPSRLGAGASHNAKLIEVNLETQSIKTIPKR